MSTQIGRISGPLLKDNLLRDGIDLAFETDLLYIDVNNKKIGIKNSSPIRDLYSPQEIKSTNVIVDNVLTITGGNIVLDNTSKITVAFDDLYFNIPQVVSTHLQVGDFDIDSVSITQTASNADFDFRPDGTGILKIVNDLNVFGNLHATGNITLEGNVIFGSDNNDNVTFSADVDSNLIPDLDDVYDLGGGDRKWQTTYAELLNGEVVTLGSALLGGINPSLRQGNIWYVAAAGSSDYVGNHQNGPFESIERALANAVSGDIVFVYPGTYYELLPLTVPEGVSIKGIDIRTVIIEPDTSSGGQDVFLLNEACTISDLTVKNHTFDNLNNTGYAFRFANNINIQTRSPYVQNITVISSGVNAGKGAYIDGAVADTNTIEASMLFHSATFITPGVDCITMINGVRVEWLNSFTYYSERGLYALQGTGRTTLSGTRYGAEVRSIGSANVYGTYGVVADGADTLMYLINHNFAYIGTGTDSSNDPTLVVQANETVELNSGKIHYTSFDHVGTFRVGDTFWIDLKNGTTSFDLSSISVSDLAGIKFIDGDNITYVDFSRVETGNIQIAGNIIRSNIGDLNITSASNEINLDQDIFIFKNLDISNNFTIAGQLNLGNQTSDTVTFDAEIDDNLDPKANNLYNIGSPSRNWKNIWSRTAKITDIEIDTNFIRTTISNADLELRANGSGSILLEDIRVNQNIISTDVTNIQITPNSTLDITASTTNVNGDFHVVQDLIIDADTTFGNNFSDNIRFESTINTSVEPSINSIYSLGDSQRSWNLYVGKILLDDIEINDNYIRTTVSNLNLELRASGTGSVQLEQTYINENLIYTVGNNLKIEPATTFEIIGNTFFDSNLHVTNNIEFNTDVILGNDETDTVQFVSSINSSILPQVSSTYSLGSSNKSWNLYTGKVLLDNIEINDNYIKTTSSNSNLELRANGTGSVQLEQTYINENLIYTVGTNLTIQPATTLDITTPTTNINGEFYVTNDTYFDSNLNIGNSSVDILDFKSSINSSFIPNYNVTYSLGDNNRSWNLYTNLFLLDDIEINDNYIRTTVSNSNLELRASGTGSVQLEQTYINENLIYTVGNNLKIEPATTLDITASTTNVNGNFHVTGDVILDSNLIIGNNNIDTILIPARFNTDFIPYIDSNYNLGNTTRAWNLYTDKILLDDIEINDNYIQGLVSNINLEFKASGTGAVRIERIDFNENIIRTTSADKLELRPATTLDIFSTTNVTGSVNITGDFDWQGTITFGNANTDDIVFVADINSDLIPDSDNTYNIGSLSKRWNILYSRNAFIGDIEINTNYITTTNGNKDLDLRGNSNGGVRLEDLIFRSNTLESGVTNQNIQFDLSGNSILDVNTNTALRIPRGTVLNRPIANMQSGELRFNTTDNLFSGFTSSRVTFGGVYSADRITYARVEPTSNIITFVANSVNSAYVNTSKVWITGLLVDSLSFQNNTISTLLGGGIGAGPTALTRSGDTLIFRDGAELIGSSTPFSTDPNLILDPDLNNTIDIDNFRFDDNEINNLSNLALTFISTGTGYVKFDGTLGIKIPAGTDSERPITPAQGTTRWSTEQDWLEIYIGTSWQLATATSGSAFATPAEIREATDIWTLILG